MPIHHYRRRQRKRPTHPYALCPTRADFKRGLRWLALFLRGPPTIEELQEHGAEERFNPYYPPGYGDEDEEMERGGGGGAGRVPLQVRRTGSRTRNEEAAP